MPPPIALYEPSGALFAHYDKLSQAVTESPNQGLIVVRGGTILDNEETEIEIDGKEITITGQLGSNFTIDMAERDRIFHITGGASVTLENIDLTGGSKSNSNKGGGAIYLSSSATQLTIRRSRIVGNRAAEEGGGIYMFSGFLSIFDSLIQNNIAGTTGGGIDARGGVLLIHNSEISRNCAGTSGGGLYLTNAATMTTCAVSENAATRYGGGVFLSIGQLTAEDTSILSNSCVDMGNFGEGGGIFVYNNGALCAENLLIDGNTAKKNGGGIVLNQGSIAANHLTVSNNTASTGEGGGIFRNPSGGILTTNGSLWEQAGNRRLEFSVSPEGEVRADGTRQAEDPVQMTQNLAFSETSHQMKW